MKKVRARARARALHQLIQHLKLGPISPPAGTGLGLGWDWAGTGAELSNMPKFNNVKFCLV